MSLAGRHLTKEREFLSVYRRGRRLRSPSLAAWSLKVPAGEPSRFAVVVSSKVSAKSTKRNLIRRRVWAALRKHYGELPAKGLHLVISAQHQAAKADYVQISKDVASIVHTH